MHKKSLLWVLLFLFPSGFAVRASDAGAPNAGILGFRDAAGEQKLEQSFLAVPDTAKAEEHLRILTKAPHLAGTPEDQETADYVAAKFREAGLETEIKEYKVWINYPSEVSVDVTAPAGVKMHGPRREHVDDDPFQDDPRVVTPYNGMSPSGDVEAEVVYANYGTPADFKRLEDMKIDVRGKLVLVRYGQNFRGVKVFVAQEHGAAGVIIYSDPADDGFKRGDKYPKGPWRPDSGVQRGSVGYMFNYAGDPTTPGFASTPALPEQKRVAPEKAETLPKIPSTPLSYADAWPILENLGGPAAPREWQGALPFTYHLGGGPVRVKLHLKQDYQLRTIWDVIGKVPGRELPKELVVAGNHRDAWVYGAVDPNSGTAAMLEAVHGIGELLRDGWRPKRTMIFASWDAEEQGLMGSTEWAEEHAGELGSAVAYFNLDVAVTGPDFSAAAVPSLKDFIREITKVVPSPSGGSVYTAWRGAQAKGGAGQDPTAPSRPAAPSVGDETPVGDLGSGSDFTVFLQHLGVPSTDMTSSGPYGVYHSVFDNFAWFKKFADPHFDYEQQMARIFGLEVLRMANCDVLPYEYEQYGKEIGIYLNDAEKKAIVRFPGASLDFKAAQEAASRFTKAGTGIVAKQKRIPGDAGRLNEMLLSAEHAMLLPGGLPNRPWFRHAIYAPGQYTGYAAVVIPGVNESIDRGDRSTAQQQLDELTSTLNRATQALTHH